ncbi:MAG TPA: phosphate signaling complex protein PhoU [Candidatus Limnocylindria bacterium]|nr:phosphate signaling complex protein PhoU [Candidatus Limnocylindria bacterium]
MTTIHQRAGLDQGMEQLRRDLRRLASMVDVAIEKSVASLARLDAREAEQVIVGDKAINDLRYGIEDAAVHLIAMQQPIAGDLRFIIAVLMVTSELERMGDYCVGLAKITKLHGDRPLLKPLIDIPRMAEAVRRMLRGSVDALITKNAFLAEAIASQDDEIDRLYDQIYRELLTYMLNDPTTIDRATWLLWAAHNLERMGDRVQNICERTVYEATGVLKEFGGRGGQDDTNNDA